MVTVCGLNPDCSHHKPMESNKRNHIPKKSVIKNGEKKTKWSVKENLRIWNFFFFSGLTFIIYKEDVSITEFKPKQRKGKKNNNLIPCFPIAFELKKKFQSKSK